MYEYDIDLHTDVDLEYEKERAEYEWAQTPVWERIFIAIELFISGVIYAIRPKQKIPF